MKLLGIEIRHPEQKELIPAILLIGMLAALMSVLFHFEMLSGKIATATLAGGTVGIVTASFGVSVKEHGLRAVVLIAAIGLISSGVYMLFGVIG